MENYSAPTSPRRRFCILSRLRSDDWAVPVQAYDECFIFDMLILKKKKENKLVQYIEHISHRESINLAWVSGETIGKRL